VSLLDVPPTLFALVGLPIPPQFRGTSLVAPLPDHGPRAVSGKGDGWFLREGDWKLVLGGEGRALYDVSDDPGEKLNLLGSHPVTATYLEARLWARSPAYREPGLETLPVDHGLEEEERAELKRLLRVLGYVE
jgi:arylsulfatase A-like enzyme